MTVQLSGQVPGEQLNGLADLEPELIKDETMRVTALCTFEVTKIVHNVQKQDTFPVVRLLHIEPVKGDLEKKAKALQLSAYQSRTGENTLDLPDVDESGDDA
jgi:hypothetical protein